MLKLILFFHIFVFLGLSSVSSEQALMNGGSSPGGSGSGSSGGGNSPGSPIDGPVTPNTGNTNAAMERARSASSNSLRSIQEHSPVPNNSNLPPVGAPAMPPVGAPAMAAQASNISVAAVPVVVPQHRGHSNTGTDLELMRMRGYSGSMRDFNNPAAAGGGAFGVAGTGDTTRDPRATFSSLQNMYHQ